MAELTDSSVRGSTSRRARLVWLTMALAVGLALGGRELGSEHAVSLQGDMPRYLMNGVFLHDLLRDAPVASPFEYAQRYYARYPALSLGHHPILTAAAEVPFYWAFGVSVRAARLTQLAFLAVAAVFFFLLVARLYDATSAGFATLLLVTAPRIVVLTQAVLSEMAAVACIAGALYFLDRYTRSRAGRDAAGFGAFFVASLYAKQLAAVMVPVYVIWVVLASGWRALVTRQALVALALSTIAIVPLAVMTARVGVFNVTVALTGRPPELPGRSGSTRTPGAEPAEPALPSLTDALQEGGARVGERLERYVDDMGDLVGTWTLVLAGVGAAFALVTRDRRAIAVLLWSAIVLAEIAFVGWVQTRYLIYAAPALCLLAVAPFGAIRRRWWHLAWAVALALAVAQQGWQASAMRPVGAEGYEEAARYVAARPGAPVLYSAAVDSGYFVFFVRKHDPLQHSVVLRADKLLTTSRMSRLSVADRVSSPEQVLEVLRQCGVRFVVVEEGNYPKGPLTWLNAAVRGVPFAERRRFPLRSSDARLNGRSLVVYERTGAGPADPGYVLHLGIPLVGRSVEVRLSELLPAPPR
jgi:hypothetical protein